MPQITLTLSNNIDTKHMDFRALFAGVHEILGAVPGTNIKTCHSGVMKEDFSYIGLGDANATRIYLEIYWLEKEERKPIKKQLSQQLFALLEKFIEPGVAKQNLVFAPRVRICNLGKLDEDYFIYNKSS